MTQPRVPNSLNVSADDRGVRVELRLPAAGLGTYYLYFETAADAWRMADLVVAAVAGRFPRPPG